MNLRMREKYLDKACCKRVAGRCIEKYGWTNVTQEQLAKEIYGHAFVYYKWDFLKKLPIADKEIYSHVEDGIDIADETDRFQAVWELIWRL